MNFKKLLSAFLLTLFLVAPALADVYVQPELEREMAEIGIMRKLLTYSPAQRRAEAKKMLKNIPLERQELDMKIEEAKARQERGERRGPPVYMLRKGHDSINEKEAALSRMLQYKNHGVWTAPQSNKEHVPPQVSQSAPFYPAVGALALFGFALLLGVRRKLRSQA